MSRWIEQFQNHPYRVSWSRVKSALEGTFIDDPSVSTYVSELARLRKVVEYIDGLLDSLDPELLPFSMLDNFNQQATICADQVHAYNTNRNIAHLQEANAYADNLLSYVRPYLIHDGKVGNALRKAAQGYSKTYEERSALLDSWLSEFSRNSQAKISYLDNVAKKFDSTLARVEDGSERLFGEEGLLAEMDDKVQEARKEYSEIKAYHEKIFVGSSGDESLKASADTAHESIIRHSETIGSLISSANNSIKKIQDFEKILLGDPAVPEGDSISAFVERQKQKLADFEVEQASRTEALIQKIESLIPGATSAGLATAYHEMKNSFDAPIRAASRIFYGTITVLIIGSILLCVQKVYWLGIEFIPLPDWQSSLRSFAYKLPFYGAAVWLAYYASKRRSEFQRLQQEYAHKEALAKSYDSFKRQIEALGSKDDVLMAMLLEKAIGAIAHNASQTLDGKHGDKSPSQDALDKVLGNLNGLKDFFQK